jgi:hypothetical protein
MSSRLADGDPFKVIRSEGMAMLEAEKGFEK